MSDKGKDQQDSIGDSEPDMDAPESNGKPQKKKKGGKVVKAHGVKPKKRLDKKARSGEIE